MFFFQKKKKKNPKNAFPTGFADQTGGPNAPNTKLNIPLPARASWENGYKAAVQRAVDGAKAFGAQALVVSLGLDTYKDDPVVSPYGGFQLDAPDYFQIASVLGSCSLPTVVVQEGGYNFENIPSLVEEFMKGLDQSLKL